MKVLKNHNFELATQGSASVQTAEGEQVPTQSIKITLETDLQWQPFVIDYRLLKDDEVITSGQRNAKDIERQIPTTPITEKTPNLVLSA